jgi:hypothetical protein
MVCKSTAGYPCPHTAAFAGAGVGFMVPSSDLRDWCGVCDGWVGPDGAARPRAAGFCHRSHYSAPNCPIRKVIK